MDDADLRHYSDAIAALKPFAERWKYHTQYTEEGLPPPPNAKMTAITPGALRRAAEVFYGETITGLDTIDRLLEHPDPDVKGE